MEPLSIIAFVTGVAGVWLTIKKSIWCWPVALISVGTSAIEFFKQKLYGDMSLQAVYFAAGIYGWYYWSSKSKTNFIPEKTPKEAWIWIFMITALQSLLYLKVLKLFNGDQVLLDAILTAASLTATYMMTRRWMENWAAWVLIDLVYVILYFLKAMWLFGFLYLIFAAMAYYGWKRWKAEELKK